MVEPLYVIISIGVLALIGVWVVPSIVKKVVKAPVVPVVEEHGLLKYSRYVNELSEFLVAEGRFEEVRALQAILPAIHGMVIKNDVAEPEITG